MSENKYGLDFGENGCTILSKTEVRKDLGHSVEYGIRGKSTYIPETSHLRSTGVFMVAEEAARVLSRLIGEINPDIIEERLKAMGYSEREIEIIQGTVQSIDTITPILDKARVD